MIPSEISSALGLSSLKNRTWSIFKTSAIKGEGLEDAMEWSVISFMETVDFALCFSLSFSLSLSLLYTG